MKNYRLSAICHFGLEAILKKEIISLGYKIDKVTDGRVIFFGDNRAVCKTNIWLRTAERVLITLGEFKAITFEEMFQEIKKINWENFIPEDGIFWVKKASSINSRLFSTKDIQSVIKKAIVERLKGVYHVDIFKENGNEYPIRVLVHKDNFFVDLDTSGESLHKRGYRKVASSAPISETLAAGMILLSPWKNDRTLVDLFAGSGTIPIEAAMISLNMAPGINRTFVSQGYENFIDSKIWEESFEEAKCKINYDIEIDIQGYDNDYKIIKIARENARVAGVEKYIHFQEKDSSDFSSKKKYGVLISNPPYGERQLAIKDVETIYKNLGKLKMEYDTWTFFIITSYEGFEKWFDAELTKTRKLYNGMLKTNLYQFWGSKPVKNV